MVPERAAEIGTYRPRPRREDFPGEGKCGPHDARSGFGHQDARGQHRFGRGSLASARKAFGHRTALVAVYVYRNHSAQLLLRAGQEAWDGPDDRGPSERRLLRRAWIQQRQASYSRYGGPVAT